MPTIFDKYEIHFDGNNVYCDYPVIIGVNGTNTTKLIFDADAGIEHFVLKTSAGGELSYAPVNDIVTLTLSASYAGEDYDCLVMLEAGNYHLQVSRRRAFQILISDTPSILRIYRPQPIWCLNLRLLVTPKT